MLLSTLMCLSPPLFVFVSKINIFEINTTFLINFFVNASDCNVLQTKNLIVSSVTQGLVYRIADLTIALLLRLDKYAQLASKTYLSQIPVSDSF